MAMNGTAYEFAREVDRQIEALTPDDYHRKRGRGKRLQEELYPISRLALSLKQPGLEIEVEAFEDSGRADGRIREVGLRDREYDVQVTYVYNYEESLRKELLAAQGYSPGAAAPGAAAPGAAAPGAGDIFRDNASGKVVAGLAAVDCDEHVTRISNAVIGLFRKKSSMPYDPNTVLLIAFDEIMLCGGSNWSQLFASIEKQGGFSGNTFLSVYLFNSATNELQRAA